MFFLIDMAIQVTYRRTRRLSMRIVKNGDVHVSAPIGMPKNEVERFIEEHREWIAEARKRTYESQKRRADFYNQLPLKTKEQADDALRRRASAMSRTSPSASRPICCCCRNGVSSTWWFTNYAICWSQATMPVSMH